MTGNRETTFSPDRKYRYTLWREWSELLGEDQICNFICLNPSTADETKDDPTIRRCIDFSKRWGYTAFVMTNLFAWRDTSPTEMMKQAKPIGAENDDWIHGVASYASRVVIAWGKDGGHMGRGPIVRRMLQESGIRLHHLGRCQNGEPKHPLYLPKITMPQAW